MLRMLKVTLERNQPNTTIVIGQEPIENTVQHGPVQGEARIILQTSQPLEPRDAVYTDVRSCLQLIRAQAQCNLYELLERVVAKLQSRRPVPETMTQRVSVDKKLVFPARKRCLVRVTELWLRKNLERPELTRSWLRALQRAKIDA